MRRRRPVQWVVNSATYGTLSVVPFPGTLGMLLTGNVMVTGSDPPQIGRFTIERVVGEIFIRPPASFIGAVGDVFEGAFGICWVSGPSAGIANPDPLAVADGDYSWMWLRHFVFTVTEAANLAGGYNMGVLGWPMFHVDAVSKRAARNVGQLRLVGSSGGGSTQGFRVVPYLRTLISRVA